MKCSKLSALALVAVLSGASCSAPPHADSAVAGPQIAPVAFMVGTWRADGGESFTEERWSAGCSNLMLGTGITVRNGAAVFFEYLRIERRHNGLVYIAQPRGQPPTDFPMTASTADSVTFENPGHDFPRRIMYARHGNVMTATVDGGPEGASNAGLPAESWTLHLQP